jgi:hypothetical protein
MRTASGAMRAAMTAGALAVTLAAPVAPLSAQEDPRAYRRPPLRLEVRPAPRYHRRCVDWYAVERRFTGNTITPQVSCWWTLRP